ncbi:MAG: WD40/YVTN/BNR-like repeat-containing protein [Candidatus Nitrosocosmicus sp.]
MGSKKTKGNNHTNNNKKLNKKSSQKLKLIVVAIAIAIASIGIISFMTTSASENNGTNSSSQNLTGNWMDVHGVGVSPAADTNDNKNSLYLATHHGLYKKDIGNTSSSNNTSGWVEVGNDKSDLMGFMIDPVKNGTMYSSGHPQTGGNLGFRISEDYGKNWQKVSDVTTPRPIDFHTMAVGNNPEIIYAASGMGNNIFISTDGGENWTIATPPAGQQVVTLATNQSNSNTVYTGTTGGVYSSIDKGKNWQKINNALFGDNDTSAMVTGIEISPDGKTVYAFVAPSQVDDNSSGYIIKSTDGAKTWTKTNDQINGAVFISKFAFGNNGEIYAALIQDSPQTGVAASVFSSYDDGNTWSLEGTNNRSLLEI